MASNSLLMKMGWRKRAFPATAGAVVLLPALFYLFFFNPNALEGYGFQLFDRFQKSAPRPYEDVDVRVVDIDEESIRRIGQWPWSRLLITEMTERLVEAGAGIVSYDVIFSEPDRTSPENLRPLLERGGADPAALESLSTYRPHDEVMAESFLNLPVILGYFFENFEGDTEPLRRTGPVVFGESPIAVLPTYRSVTTTLKSIEQNALDAGFVSVEGDEDNVVRAAPLLAAIGDQIYPSLSLATTRYLAEALGQPNTGAYRIETSTASGEFGAAVSEVTNIRIGQISVPTTEDGRMWIHYTEDYSARAIPAWKVLDENTSLEELSSLLGGDYIGASIVFVGAGAQGLYDLKATPFGVTIPGVHVHAMATEQMILGHYLVQPDWSIGVRFFALFAGGVILILVVPLVGALWSGLLSAGMIGGLFGVSWHLYSSQQLLFDPVYPAVALLAVFIIVSLVSFFTTEAEKSHINGAFSRYLSPEMVAKIADDPGQLSLGGEEREMTILFSDIRSFSKISEGMTPEQLTDYLNRYLTPMTDILMRHRATVDKYIGDAVMAFWNAPLDDPDQYRNAARSALEMVEVLNEMNAARERGENDPTKFLPVDTQVGIGLCSGMTSVGNMGSEQRFDYSVLGDTVNTSSRLEGMTKQYGVKILCGDKTAEHLSDFAVLELDRAKAVGKDTWLAIFCVVGDEKVAQDKDFSVLKSMQDDFLAAYRAKDFNNAQTMVGDLSRVGQKFGLEKHYAIMAERIALYREDPPPDDWEGVYVLRQK